VLTAVALLAALPQQVWVLSPALELLYANPPLLSYAGRSLGQLQAQGWPALIDPADWSAFAARWAEAQARGQFEQDYRVRAADGSHQWHLALARPMPGAGASGTLWLGTHTHIHARKEAEQRLREADELWKLALESNGDGVWDWYVQTGVELYSPRYLQMYGFEAEEIQPKPDEFDARTHPDDVAQMARDREAHFAGLTPIYSNEHRVRCKDESWKWVLTRGMVISRDEDGRPLRMVGTHTDISQRKAHEALIWQQARYDALTGLPNRRLLRERLELLLPQGAPLAVLFIDLDHFKEVNDTLGHGMGDELLVQAAQRISARLGTADIVARMGGDEFTVVLTGAGGRDAAEQSAQQIIAALAESFQLQSEKVFVSASIGISRFPQDGVQIEALLKHADQALYVAKGAGRNRLSHFTPALQEAAQTRVRLGNDLREALPGGQFSLAYQPIVELASGSIHKAEALLRWQHHSRGAVSPADFIPMAESSGLILEIGEWVFQQAARQVQQWRAGLAPRLQISINKSPVQFRSYTSSLGEDCDWAKQLAALGLPGDAIAVEITEGLLLEADDVVRRRLQALRAGGLPISLDDFGTGYSSLSYLQQHAIDVIKIDRVFVRNLQPGAKDLALCKAIITMAHELGMQVVAEGVETEVQRDLLHAIGCDYGQGYWFARPMPAEDFEALLQTSKA